MKNIKTSDNVERDSISLSKSVFLDVTCHARILEENTRYSRSEIATLTDAINHCFWTINHWVLTEWQNPYSKDNTPTYFRTMNPQQYCSKCIDLYNDIFCEKLFFSTFKISDFINENLTPCSFDSADFESYSVSWYRQNIQRITHFSNGYFEIFVFDDVDKLNLT